VKILEIMERVDSNDTNLVIAFIKDAFHQIQSSNEINTEVNKQNIVADTRDYDLPAGLIAIKSVSVLDTEDDNKYKSIRRLQSDPLVTEDTNP
tara:strand:- start:2103 stop:2381 length:279 start_codon:yes stop_codon:yes gene_type:complete